MAPAPGTELRFGILRRDAESKILEPLRTHGWEASIEREVAIGEYLVISATRGAAAHKIALLYTSATDNKVYRLIATEVEHIFFNGAPYMLDSFAYGLDKPTESVDQFATLLLRWNQSSADGKFSAAEPLRLGPVKRRPLRLLQSEAPIEAIWLRLRQLQSIALARKTIAERAERQASAIDPAKLETKAEGVSYALRNASDYFRKVGEPAIGQRVVNLYYGALSFAFAEILAAPEGADTLEVLENSTKLGHGLYTVDGEAEVPHSLVVGVLPSGFFPVWMKAIGSPIPNLPDKRPKTWDALARVDANTWMTVEQLFATLPEVSDLFADIFESPTRWVEPAGDMEANLGGMRIGSGPRQQSYIKLVDQFGRLTREDIARFPGPISDIREVDSEGDGRHYRVLVDHAGHANAWGALTLHHSPFQRSALLLPIFGVIGDYRVVCVVLLYALSIIVRYRPSLWRRIQDGDLDHLRALIEGFIAVAERILPQAFMETIVGQPVYAKQPGTF